MHRKRCTVNITSNTSDELVSREVGERLRRLRLNRNLGQNELAAEAGVGRSTLQRLEEGETVTLPTLLRVMRALGQLKRINQVLPAEPESPIEELERRGRTRRRAGARRRPEGQPGLWRWGYEDEDEED